MKNFLRRIGAFIILGPFIASYYILRIITGKERAGEIIGPVLTSLAKQFIKILLPEIQNAGEFDLFVTGYIKSLKYWRPFYDVTWICPDPNTLQLKIDNCPFCELLSDLHLSHLNPYVCQGDWKFAEENKNNWDFAREHQIGTNDPFCDHTYKRKMQDE